MRLFFQMHVISCLLSIVFSVACGKICGTSTSFLMKTSKNELEN